MLDIMYEIPKDDNIGSVTITKAYIEGKGSPMIAMRGTPALPESSVSEQLTVSITVDTFPKCRSWL